MSYTLIIGWLVGCLTNIIVLTKLRASERRLSRLEAAVVSNPALPEPEDASTALLPPA